MESSILDRACQTEGEHYDTGIRIKGFEVWGIPPHRYRQFTEFYLRHPQGFPYEVREGRPFLGERQWEIGYETPDGVFRTQWSSFKSEAEAQQRMPVWTKGELAYPTCMLAVAYKSNGMTDGAFVSKGEGIPWGKPWVKDYSWQAFSIEITPDEAQQVLDWAETVQAEWKKRSSDWIAEECDRTEAIAHAVALDGLNPSTLHLAHGPTECLECGATYDKPGHVEPGGMSCDRC